jgi:hypothetical protein
MFEVVIVDVHNMLGAAQSALSLLETSGLLTALYPLLSQLLNRSNNQRTILFPNLVNASTGYAKVEHRHPHYPSLCQRESKSVPVLGK